MKILRLSALVVFFAVLSGFSSQIFCPGEAEYFWGGNTERKTYTLKMAIEGAGITEGTMILRQDGTAIIGGTKYYKLLLTTEGIPGATTANYYTRLGEDGIYSRETTDSSVLDSLDIPLPVQVGRKWQHIQGDTRLEMEVLAFEDLDTAEKTYRHCLKIAGKGMAGSDISEETMYYAPKVGLVKGSATYSLGVLMEILLREP